MNAKERGALIEAMFTFTAALTEPRGRSAAEVERLTGFGQRRVYRWLRAGERAGAVERLEGKQPRQYRLKRRRR